MEADILGWIAAAILLLTMMRQVWAQWRTRSVAGVSKWLFVGQLAASITFTIYSWMVQNWVFVVTNALMVLNALIGEAIYLRNKRIAAAQKGRASVEGGSPLQGKASLAAVPNK